MGVPVLAWVHVLGLVELSWAWFGYKSFSSKFENSRPEASESIGPRWTGSGVGSYSKLGNTQLKLELIKKVFKRSNNKTL